MSQMRKSRLRSNSLKTHSSELVGQGFKPDFPGRGSFHSREHCVSSFWKAICSLEQGAASCGSCSLWLWLGHPRSCFHGRFATGDLSFDWSCGHSACSWAFPREGETGCEVGPGRQGAGLAPIAKSACFQGTGSGSGRAWPPLNVLSWLSALGGVASGSWERASGFGPWDSWPPEAGFSHAPLAVSPAAVHTQD